jgi:membrane protease YdiL (CAAX protease family)
MSFFDLSPTVMQSGLVALAVFLMLRDIPVLRRLKLFTSSAIRLSIYRSGTLSLWLLAFGALLLSSPGDLWLVRQAGAGMAWLTDSTLALTAAVALSAAYFCMAFAPGLHCRVRPAARRKYHAALRPLQFMLPVSASERRWWILVSITAGVCEEVFFRGFLPQFLSGELHGGWKLEPAGAWLLSVLIFGMGHSYQGAAGIVRTAVGGLMFSVLAIVTGNLLLPIVVHALVDLSVLWMYRPQSDDPAAAALLIQGSAPAEVARSIQPAN